MPKIAHRVSVEQDLSTRERLLVALMLRLVNPLRTHAQLPPMTLADVAQLLRQLLRDREDR